MSHPFITRFAPSPTGHLHLGHAYAARVAHYLASESGGKMILRIDDIDYTRCKDEFISPIFANLNWLGLDWYGRDPYGFTSIKQNNVPRQSHRYDQYRAALKTLKDLSLIYPCFLSRSELNELLSAPHAPSSNKLILEQQTHRTVINTDQFLSVAEQGRRQAMGRGPAWRLRMDAALKVAQEIAPRPLSWYDHIVGHQIATPAEFGDIVIARADIAVSYHLSVVVDDALDGINLVTRGNDLAPFTHLHRLLQTLLSLPVPDYCHHPLVLNANGKRLAKRDAAHSLDNMRKHHSDPTDIFEKMPPIPAIKSVL